MTRFLSTLITVVAAAAAADFESQIAQPATTEERFEIAEAPEALFDTAPLAVDAGKNLRQLSGGEIQVPPPSQCRPAPLCDPLVPATAAASCANPANFNSCLENVPPSHPRACSRVRADAGSVLCDGRLPESDILSCANSANANKHPCVVVAQPAQAHLACSHLDSRRTVAPPAPEPWDSLCDSRLPASAAISCSNPANIDKTACDATPARGDMSSSCALLNPVRGNDLCDPLLRDRNDPASCNNADNAGKLQCAHPIWGGENELSCRFLRERYAERLCARSLPAAHEKSCSNSQNFTKMGCNNWSHDYDTISCSWLRPQLAAGLCDPALPATMEKSCSHADNGTRAACSRTVPLHDVMSCSTVDEESADQLCSASHAASVPYSCAVAGNANKQPCTGTFASNGLNCQNLAFHVQEDLCNPARASWSVTSCSWPLTRGTEACIDDGDASTDYRSCSQLTSPTFTWW